MITGRCGASAFSSPANALPRFVTAAFTCGDANAFASDLPIASNWGAISFSAPWNGARIFGRFVSNVAMIPVSAFSNGVPIPASCFLSSGFISCVLAVASAFAFSYAARSSANVTTL